MTFLRKYTQFILIVIFLSLTYLSYYVFELSQTPPKIAKQGSVAPFVKTVTLSPKEENISLTFPANVIVRNYVGISPRTSGRVEETHPNLKTGGSFKKDEQLFQISTTSKEIEIAGAEAKLKKEQANLELIKAEADIAIQEWNILHPNKKIPDLVAKKPYIARAIATVQEAQAEVDAAKRDLYYTEFRLPFAGRIESNTIEKGSLVTEGQTYGRAYAEEAIEILLQVPYTKAQTLSAQNYKAEFLIDDKTYPATIDRIQSVLNPENRVQDIILKPKPETLPFITPGMFVTARLIKKIPESLYILSEDMLEDNHILRLLNDKKQVIRHKATLLGRDNDRIFVKSLGYDITLIVGTTEGLADGMVVNNIPPQINNNNTPKVSP